MTPWQCYCKSVQIFLPNLNFSCKESASKCIDFGPHVRRLNSGTISICGGIWGNFWEFLERLSFAKEIALKNLAWESLLKLTIKGIVWWCASIGVCDKHASRGSVCDNKLSVEGLPTKFLKIFLWYFNKLMYEWIICCSLLLRYEV